MEIKHVLSEEVGHFAEVKNIPNTEEFFSYNDNELIILNKNFDLNAKAKIKLDYVFKPVVCSQNGEYLATIKHGANLYSLKGLNIISNCFVKGATDISFFKDSKNLIVAARNGSYVLEI